MSTLRPLRPTPAATIYGQNLRQSHYTRLPATILACYKFALPTVRGVPALKGVQWSSFVVRKPVTPRYHLFTHFLFTWFHKQTLPAAQWQGGAQHWSSTAAVTTPWFYLLRYAVLGRCGVYPFVPTVGWAQLQPRQLALLPWPALGQAQDLPLPLEDYLELEWAAHYRLGFHLRCTLPAALPRWFAKVFTLRSYHYPVVYQTRTLPILQALSLVSLKQPYHFDELATARFAMTTRKKRLLTVFKALLRVARRRQLVTEYALAYRIREQLQLPAAVSPAAEFFQLKWHQYLAAPTGRR